MTGYFDPAIKNKNKKQTDVQTYLTNKVSAEREIVWFTV